MNLSQAERLLKLHKEGYSLEIYSLYFKTINKMRLYKEDGDIFFDSLAYKRARLLPIDVSSVKVYKPVQDWWE